MTDKRTVEVIDELDIPTDLLWRTISDFEHIDLWADLNVISIEGKGIGCKRTVEMESGLLVTERLLICDPQKMIFSYAILEPNPYPMQDYVATASVKKISAQGSLLEWSGTYFPAVDADPARTDNLLKKIYSNGIQRLLQHYANRP